MNMENLSNAWRGNLSCEDCSTRLTVFRKKRICYFCKHSFCHICVVRREDKKICCRKCQILTARPLDRNELLNLRSRDLINYLSSRQIPTNGCVEKEDLVNLLITAVNNACFHPSSTACIDSSINSNGRSQRNTSDSAAHFSQNSVKLCNDGIRITGLDSVENEGNEGHPSNLETVHPLSGPHGETEQFPSSSEPRLPQTDVQNREGIPKTSSQITEFPSNLNGASGGDGFLLRKPLKLSDIKNRSDLDALSIKQLKELLMMNRTDFKGCVEKAELIQKVDRLWSDYKVSRKDLENLSLEEMCKICMDAPIECVLLECGHLATCTSCGKQLCECPICRQFVVRCVRTFKA